MWTKKLLKNIDAGNRFISLGTSWTVVENLGSSVICTGTNDNTAGKTSISGDTVVYKYENTGADMIAHERIQQVCKHDRTIEHDVEENAYGQLAQAAIALLDPNKEFPVQWNVAIVGKMMNKSYKERLIIAGAFLAAEFDRIEAMEAKGETPFLYDIKKF